MRHELIIFDCDGVLVQSEHLANRAEVELFRRFGWHLEPEQARAFFKGKSVGQVTEAVVERVGARLPDDWIYDWAMATAREFVRHLRPVPGIELVLQRLAERNAPSCVASQSSLSRVRLSLELCGLDAHFADRIYTASMVRRGKPAPDLFLHAARVQRAEPAACAVIEDSPTGVEAGIAAGMTVYGYAADEDAAALAGAGAEVFTDMSQLPELLGT